MTNLTPMASSLDDEDRREALELAEEDTPQLTTEEKNALLSALYESNISDIREAIDLELITCQELTAYYLERIEEYNEEYNCFITICDDAMEQAAARDSAIADGTAKGSLFGIPIVVKDNIRVAGYPTTNGLYSPWLSTANAEVVELLINEGAVIIAKANMSTEAQVARTCISALSGETKNAYNPLLSAGGSSGGSAVATSLNFCTAALGTDTNASLRIPSALNGCISLRVTTGLISTENVIVLNPNRDVVGAITRTVEDQAIMLDVLTGGVNNYYDNLDPNILAGLRIGVLEELSTCNDFTDNYDYERSEKNLDPEIVAAFDKATKELEACGAEIIYVSMPDIFNLSQWTFSTERFSDIQYFGSEFEGFLTENGLDAVIFPSYLSTPIRSGVDEEGNNWNPDKQPFINNCSVLSSCAAIPEITVPIGTHSLGAGIGMEIATYADGEQPLLDIAYSYTEKYNHRVVPEGTPDLYYQYNKGTISEQIDSYLFSLLPVPEESSSFIDIVGIIISTIK